jgi:hypothetical protein
MPPIGKGIRQDKMHEEKQNIRGQHGEKRMLKKQATICVGKI